MLFKKGGEGDSTPFLAIHSSVKRKKSRKEIPRKEKRWEKGIDLDRHLKKERGGKKGGYEERGGWGKEKVLSFSRGGEGKAFERKRNLLLFRKRRPYQKGGKKENLEKGKRGKGDIPLIVILPPSQRGGEDHQGRRLIFHSCYEGRSLPPHFNLHGRKGEKS